MIGSDNPWRMEAAVERAFRRAGHETLLVDDRRIKRLVGRRLTQRWARRHANSFRPDFVFLSKCLALDPENHTYDQRIAYLLEDREWVNPLPPE